MDSLEEYSKGWKQIKSRQTSADKHFLNLKNKKVMNNIIQFEKNERRENKWGVGLGLGGLLVAFFFGIVLPVYYTPLSLNGLILGGFTLMLLGVLYMIIIIRIERINLDKLGENSQTYLLSLKEKLKNSGRRRGWHGLAYVAFIVLGILFVYKGIFSQMSNGESSFISSIWMPVLCGMLGWMLWRIRYTRKEKNKIQPLLKEIDEMLEGLK